MLDFNVERIRSQFPALDVQVGGEPAVYFDGPGGTQVPESVMGAVHRYYAEQNSNRGGPFLTSERTDEIIHDARVKGAALLGADPDEIAFGANMTTLNFSLARALGRHLRPGDEVVITDLDHEANRDPWLDLREQGAVVKSAAMNTEDCSLDLDDLRARVSRRTRIIAVSAASNAVGTIVPLEAVREIADEVDAVMVVDAVHYVPHRLADVREIGCDFLLCSAYKAFGPHLGILYGRREAFARLHTYRVRPQGSAPPHKIETGTANHEGIAGTAAAVDFIAEMVPPAAGDTLRASIQRSMAAMTGYEDDLNRLIMDGLAEIPGVTIHGPKADEDRTPTVAFTMEDFTPGEIARQLGDQGIFVWDGDFYATTLVEKLGLAPTGGVLRVGVAPYNTEDEVKRLITAVEQLR